MNIRALVRRHYADAVSVTHDTAMRFPPGSRERDHWLAVADHYRVLNRQIDAGDPVSAGQAMEPEPL